MKFVEGFEKIAISVGWLKRKALRGINERFTESMFRKDHTQRLGRVAKMTSDQLKSWNRLSAAQQKKLTTEKTRFLDMSPTARKHLKKEISSTNKILKPMKKPQQSHEHFSLGMLLDPSYGKLGKRLEELSRRFRRKK
jgi:hypothetical protein